VSVGTLAVVIQVTYRDMKKCTAELRKGVSGMQACIKNTRYDAGGTVVNTTVSKRRIELPSTCRLVGTAAQRERERERERGGGADGETMEV
jgi:hypothetical protein